MRNSLLQDIEDGKVYMEFKTNLINSWTKSDSGAIKSKLITHETQVLGSREIIPKNPCLHTSHVLTLFHYYGLLASLRGRIVG